MLKQVLQQDYVRTRMKTVAASDAPPKRPLPEGESPDPATVEEVRRLLTEAAQAVPDEHLADEYPAPTGPEGQAVPPLHDQAYLSRDELTSLAQSALQQYFEEFQDDVTILTDAPPSSDGFAPGEDELDPVTDRALDLPAEQDQLLGKYEITDPGWVNSVVAMGWRKLRGPHDFNDTPADPVTLGADARVVLIADWGSGLPRARKVAAQIRRIIEPDIGRRDQHVVHLGDVYYSGWEREYRRNLLDCWPVNIGEPVGSWSLNGNHDMYSGGHAYFDFLLADPRFEAQQRSSWFSVGNGDWQLLGLDTAYEDHGLMDPQGAWVAKMIDEDHGRRTILLSHHQLFSAYGSDGPELRRKLAGPLATGRVDAWFWGHEHRCVFYEHGHGGVGSARLIGHGGVPVYAHREPVVAPATYQFTESFPTSWEEWALMGFAVLEFAGGEVTVRYIDEFGREHENEELPPRTLTE